MNMCDGEFKYCLSINSIMRLYEFLNEEQLDEISIKQLAIATALFGASFGPNPANTPNMLDPNISVVRMQATVDQPQTSINRSQASIDQPQVSVDQPQEPDKFTAAITGKYRVNPDVIDEIVEIAKKYSYSDFPKTEDILSIIGIESSFDHMAKSKLKRDPAKGLMQVRPGIWKIPKSELKHIEGQIKHGVSILRKYYERLKDDEATLRAYNLGITHYKKNPDDPRGDRYIEKFEKEKQLYAGL